MGAANRYGPYEITNPMKCSAHKTNGEPCDAWAVSGQTVCRVHGAGGRALEKSIVANTTHGRRAKTYNLPALLAKAADGLPDPHDLSMEPEIHAARATLQAFMDNFGASLTLSADQARAILEAIESVTKAVEREAKRQQQLTAQQATILVARLQDLIRSAVDENVSDPTERAAVIEAIRIGLFRLGAGDR